MSEVDYDNDEFSSINRKNIERYIIEKLAASVIFFVNKLWCKPLWYIFE